MHPSVASRSRRGVLEVHGALGDPVVPVFRAVVAHRAVEDPLEAGSGTENCALKSGKRFIPHF